MAGHVTSTSSSLVAGQTVNAQLSLDLAPPIPLEQDNDEFTVNSSPYNVNTQQFLQVVGPSADAKIYLAHRPHITAAGSFNFAYNIHPTQQLWSGNQGTRFYIYVADYLSFGADRIQLMIEWGWDASALKSVVIVSDAYSELGRVQITGYIPAGKQIYIQSFPSNWIVSYDGSGIAGGSYETDIVKPMRIRYGTYKIGGQPSSITFPSGHPAFGGGYPGWIFSEATLVGQYRPATPTWTLQALNSSNVQIGSNYNPTTIGDNSDNYPIASFVVPTVAGIAKVRIRARLHDLQSSTMGTPFLDIPVTAGGSTPLAVDGPNPVTLQPGQTYTVTANYPTAQLTFAAVGGGSFGTGGSANVFTAGADAVTSATCHFTVTRTATSETVNIGVNVPLKLTPESFSLIGGATQTITANGDITSWTSTGGALSGSALRSRTYTAPATVGSFVVTANMTGGLSATSTANVTSSGSAPTSGLRLEPFAGYSVALNATPIVQMLGDITSALWAKLTNLSVDGATGNLRILSNSAFGEAYMAQCVDPTPVGVASIFEWTFNATQQAIAGDLPQYIFEVQGGTETATGYVASIVFSYNGSADNWNVYLSAGGGVSFSPITFNFTWTATTQIRVEFSKDAPGNTTILWKFRANSGVGFSTIASMVIPAANFQPRFIVTKFSPSVVSRSNGSIIVAKPVLISGFGRWYRPNWTASRVDGSGNILGSYPVTPGEDTTYTSAQYAQTAAITCNAVGTARVSASFPSGVSPANTVTITIAPAGTGLTVTAPGPGITADVAPGATYTVEANADPSVLSYSCPGGTFGTGAQKNVFTAGATAGFYTLTVSRGSEVVTRQIRVLMKATPPASSLALGGTVFIDVNTTTALSFSATGGTIQAASSGAGVSRFLYTAPNVAGTYTVNFTSSINNAAATITVVASGTTPIVISNTEPLNVEAGTVTIISTNYPVTESTYSATGGSFGTAQQRHWWTAPAQAGPYTITVTHPTGGVDTIVGTVALRVTPKTPSAVGFGGQVQFTANFPTLTWTTTSGSINAAGLWTAGGTPGTFAVQVTATIAGNVKTDSATVTVFGDALALNVPNAVTLQPGGTLTITSNYPTSELTFSATGGTFGTGPTANVYTAPNNAGGYTITVVRGTQSANIAVTVPVVVTPASIAMAQSTVQVFTCNADVQLWNATGGVLSVFALRTVTYTAGTVAGSYQVTAQTALGNAASAVTNTGAASVPISIAGPALITLEPGGTYVVTTNKPIGTYSLTATGGTFESGNTYRAPQQAGPYTITATDTSGSGGGSDTLAVEVPLRLTPQNPTVLPGATQQFAVNYPAGSTSWSTNPATLITAFGYWTAPFAQGVYVIKAITTIGDATTSATVATVELVVYGPTDLTLEPSASYTVLTNLPPRGVSYTAFGGSFAANIYTAPHDAGNYYFTATYGGQTVRIDVFVPLRIEPKEVRLENGEEFQFRINAPSATWSVLGRGSINPSTGYYTAPASGGTIDKVTATTSLGSDTASVLLVDEFPFDPSYAVVSNIGRRVALVEAEDGTPFGRAKGAIRGAWEFIFENRDAAEYKAAREFFNARFPEIPVLIHDPDLDEFIGVYFDSELHRESINVCEINYSFRGKEILPSSS